VTSVDVGDQPSSLRAATVRFQFCLKRSVRCNLSFVVNWLFTKWSPTTHHATGEPWLA
jgi:hypothetical protein